MPGGAGSKKMSEAARRREAGDPSSAHNLQKARSVQLRWKGGQMKGAEEVRQALQGSVGEYLHVLDAFALGRKVCDPRIQTDCARYLVDRVAGKPTEKVQQEISRAPAVMPSDAQMEALARRVLGVENPASEGLSDGPEARADSPEGAGTRKAVN